MDWGSSGKLIEIVEMINKKYASFIEF